MYRAHPNRVCANLIGGDSAALSRVYEKYREDLLRLAGSILSDLPVERIEQRLRNLPTRGVVMEKGQMIRSLYDQRQPLYRKCAQITIDCTNKNHEQIVAEIAERFT